MLRLPPSKIDLSHRDLSWHKSRFELRKVKHEALTKSTQSKSQHAQSSRSSPKRQSGAGRSNNLFRSRQEINQASDTFWTSVMSNALDDRIETPQQDTTGMGKSLSCSSPLIVSCPIADSDVSLEVSPKACSTPRKGQMAIGPFATTQVLIHQENDVQKRRSPNEERAIVKKEDSNYADCTTNRCHVQASTLPPIDKLRSGQKTLPRSPLHIAHALASSSPERRQDHSNSVAGLFSRPPRHPRACNTPRYTPETTSSSEFWFSSKSPVTDLQDRYTDCDYDESETSDAQHPIVSGRSLRSSSEGVATGKDILDANINMSRAGSFSSISASTHVMHKSSYIEDEWSDNEVDLNPEGFGSTGTTTSSPSLPVLRRSRFSTDDISSPQSSARYLPPSPSLYHDRDTLREPGSSNSGSDDVLPSSITSNKPDAARKRSKGASLSPPSGMTDTPVSKPHTQAIAHTPSRSMRIYDDSLPASSQPQTPVGLPRHGLPEMSMAGSYTAPLPRSRTVGRLTRGVNHRPGLPMDRFAVMNFNTLFRRLESRSDQENSVGDDPTSTLNVGYWSSRIAAFRNGGEVLETTPPRERHRGR